MQEQPSSTSFPVSSRSRLRSETGAAANSEERTLYALRFSSLCPIPFVWRLFLLSDWLPPGGRHKFFRFLFASDERKESFRIRSRDNQATDFRFPTVFVPIAVPNV